MLPASLFLHTLNVSKHIMGGGHEQGRAEEQQREEKAESRKAEDHCGRAVDKRHGCAIQNKVTVLYRLDRVSD